ncbi:MAG: hypothetical protein AAFR33_08030 [Pseudomonadota bacterium]
MANRLALGLAVICASACTARGVDAPLALESGYAAREAAMMEATDQCGPEALTGSVPAWIANTVAVVADGPFRPVCARHDACYRLGEQSQSWCDDRMRDEMQAICDSGNATATYSVPVIGPSLCRFHAGAYYQAINSTYGGFAYGGAPGGEISDVRTQAIDARIGRDELRVCADVHNPTLLMQEYDLELRHSDGRLIDREPDLHEENIRAGETETLCVSTELDPRWSAENTGDTLRLSLRADTPESFAFVNDMVVVDTVEVALNE